MIKGLFAPGRVELAGNHTDHQNGRILASAIDLGIYADCEANSSNLVHIRSNGFEDFELRVDQQNIITGEFGTPKSLVRGVIAEFAALGLKVGGFNAHVTNTLPVGVGLSSSAAFGVLIGKILSALFNDNKVEPIVIARAAQQAENKYFGKPCGLMSQLTIALGHTVYADFSAHEIQPIEANFRSMGLALCLTDTGGSHAGLGTSYARIPADMVYIANLFDKGVLGDVDPKAFEAKGWDLSNRPVRRAAHFFEENERVPKMRDALIAGDAKTYIKLMNESGRSSEEKLNNIVTSATDDTKLAEGLELSKKLLEGKGAWRVHGGGFAGCVQALMPEEEFEGYKEEMEKVFGLGSCRRVNLL